MLKLTYTENGFYLERLAVSLDDWIAKRVLLCLRAATSIYIEPSVASFLIPCNLSYLSVLQSLQTENSDILELTHSDNEYVEVSLKGTWVAAEEESDEGIFVCLLSEKAELLLYQIWQEANMGASVISE